MGVRRTIIVPRSWPASPRRTRHACLRHDGRHPSSGQHRAIGQKNAIAASIKASLLIRWSIQEIRRIATKLAQRRIPHAHILAWSWRRAHQANARKAHLRRKVQL
jgi:hypothetical protein